MTKIKKVCFSGHREIKNLSATRITTENVIIHLIEQGTDTFYTGMALGFDLLTSQLVLNLKQKYPNISLIAVLPCSPEEQTKKWNETNKKEYYEILNRASDVITLSQKYYKGCMFVRNKYLTDNSELCVCYLTQDTGGTVYTVNQARKHGLKIINVAECENLVLL